MLSEFGKFCRKLRIDRGELLKDMAKNLDVTPSYLSAVEVGKRNVPKTWIKLLSEKYSLPDEEVRILKKAAINSQEQVKFELSNYSKDEKDLILAFARKFEDESFKEQFRKLLG